MLAEIAGLGRKEVHMRQHSSVLQAVLLFVTLSFATPVLANAANADDAQPPAATGVSHARVVSLSLVSGTVIARRPGSTKWAPATANTPIEEGASIATARHSIAEVQFENGSTVRLGELSCVDFTRLALAPHSGHINRLTLVLGFATLHVMPKRHDEYIVNASGASLTPQGKAEFRTDVTHDRLRVKVMTGHVQVQAAHSNQSERLAKNQVLAYDDSGSATFQVTDSIQMDDWDKWVQARDREQASLSGYADGWDAQIPFGFGGSMGALVGALGTDGF
jgi:ferric-dicitrate binding protein FerR (iron transport regulator)